MPYDDERSTGAAPAPRGQETEEERQARIYPIILSDYNPAWPQWYAEERNNLARLFGAGIVRMQHIGSTAVPGLLAKPTVAILLELKDAFEHDRDGYTAAKGAFVQEVVRKAREAP
ncbi:MAG: GrpB family protein [Oscillospiraceae bacterium]|jgi:GrpB-like predicted nucleotidyltransferase (UPF0157 family)|nr:GrpB family protein [Oscillospiraceae bacterium]